MYLAVEGTVSVPDNIVNAMHRGLEIVGGAATPVILSDDFVSTVQRLSTSTQSYAAERGTGMVAAKTITDHEPTTIVVNFKAIHDRQAQDIERLLAHEGCHSLIDGKGESISPKQFYDNYDTGLAMLCTSASIALEEFRIERHLAELGYPVAERAAVDQIDDQILELVGEVVWASMNPASADVLTYAKAVIEAMHSLSVTLGYLAGPIIAGTHIFDPTQFSEFGHAHWMSMVQRGWDMRQVAYRQVPAIQSPYAPELIFNHVDLAVSANRQFLRDLGFAIDGGAPGADWSFHRIVSNAVVDAQFKSVLAEAERRSK